MLLDSPPDHIDNMYDELEDPAEASRLLSRLSANDAGWLARHVRHRLEADREKIGEEIEQELQVTTGLLCLQIFSARLLIRFLTARLPTAGGTRFSDFDCAGRADLSAACEPHCTVDGVGCAEPDAVGG